jgi:hypothetical protein
MSANERVEQLLDFYQQTRLNSQTNWYLARAIRYEKSDRRLRIIAGMLALANSFVSGLAAIFLGRASSAGVVAWGVSLALLPALAAAILSMRRVYQYEATQHLYAQTYDNLSRLADELDSLIATRDSEGVDLEEELKDHIQKVESAIANESVQWYARASEVRPAVAPAAGTPKREGRD